MDNECLCLLPSICEVLTDPELVLHDGTCLEKLLDWFKDLSNQSGGKCLLKLQPCLLQFLCSMTKSQATDPNVFSFSLKLAGLFASKEPSFTLLEESGVLTYMFQPDCWCMLALWNDASVRYGWLQGLWNMLQHQKAVDFFCKNGLLPMVLQLQNDKSLFIASLTGQILAHFLNYIMPSVQSNSSECGAPNWCPVSTDPGSITTEVLTHVMTSLCSDDQAVRIQALRLLAVILTHCCEPLKRMLWKHVVEQLEVLANVEDDSLTQPIMAVIQAAARSPIFMQPDYRVRTLMDTMLYSRNVNESVRCATLILQLENCPDVLKRKATDVILLPLLCVTGLSSKLHELGKLNDQKSHLEKQLSRKATCVSLLTQSLSSISELICKKSLLSIPVQLISRSVISLLIICLGQHPNTLQEDSNIPHLICCCKVQRCGMGALGSLAVYEESVDSIEETFAVLLQYLQCPDLHAAVLKNVYHASLSWLSICPTTPHLWMTIRNDFFPLLKKHACDMRWEVRDSSLEFFTLLNATFRGNRDYIEVLHSSGMISVLFTSLTDVEGYVRASAVAALGEVVATCSNLQEEVVAHLLTILSQDTDGFPRRAAMKVFISMLKSSHSCTALDKFLSSVLLLGGNDCDWEVKVYSLELADLLMDNLQSRSSSQSIYVLSEKTSLMQELNKLKDLGLFEIVIKCLFDCDQPVSEKACALLLKLRTVMRETLDDHSSLTLEMCRHSWSEEIFHIYHKKQQAQDAYHAKDDALLQMNSKDCHPSLPKKIALCQILDVLDLEAMQNTLSLGSDHVINSPKSLMEDILFAAHKIEKSVVDCY